VVEEQWAQHAVQSLVWAAAGMFRTFVTALGLCRVGCDALAAIEQNVVIAFTEQGGDDNNRITVLLNRAYKVCKIDVS
jgi:anaphase-promoting complex subunit 5